MALALATWCLMTEPSLTGAEVAHQVREIVRHNGAYVMRVLRYLGVAPSHVDDVAQDVFMVAYRKFAGFEGRSSVRTWLYGICIRVASDHRRRAWVRREKPTDVLPDGDSGESPLEEVSRVRARELLLEALDSLDADKRAVFVLYEIDQLPMQEVAESCGCPVKTAYSRLYAARKELATYLRERGIEGWPP